MSGPVGPTPSGEHVDPWFRLEQVRRVRTRRPPSAELSPLFRAQIPEVRATKKRLAAIAEVWARTVPPELAERTTLRSVSRGTLTVQVPDGAARFQLDRFLRSGGEAALLEAFPGGVSRLRIAMGGSAGPGRFSKDHSAR